MDFRGAIAEFKFIGFDGNSCLILKEKRKKKKITN